MSGQTSHNDEIIIEDEEDPLADDVINPAALCNVIMEDWRVDIIVWESKIENRKTKLDPKQICDNELIGN